MAYISALRFLFRERAKLTVLFLKIEGSLGNMEPITSAVENFLSRVSQSSAALTDFALSSRIPYPSCTHFGYTSLKLWKTCFV